MALLEYSSPSWTMEIEYDSNDILTVVNPPVQRFIKALVELNKKVELAFFAVKTIAGSPNYTYQFIGKDGRQWNQELDATAEPDSMNFDVPDFFTLEEFTPHRAVREHVFTLIRDNALVNIEVTFN